jgi:hypothetical protein
MDMTQAATFLGATILISIGVLVLAILFIILNNLFSLFWKPVKILRFHDPYHHTSEPLLDKVEPALDPVIEIKPTLKKATNGNT